jgi:hypothetical protein
MHYETRFHERKKLNEGRFYCHGVTAEISQQKLTQLAGSYVCKA